MMLIDGKEWRPISFVDQLVRAIQADAKTETRRVIRGVPYWDHFGRPIMDWALSGCYIDDDDGQAWLDVQTDVDDNSHKKLTRPYGKAGDRLWVRECFSTFQLIEQATPDIPWVIAPSKIQNADFVVFRDGAVKWHPEKRVQTTTKVQVERMASAKVEDIKFRPPMHLPFWAYRIGLEVKSIRIERLQEITEGGACAEGFQNGPFENFGEVSALFKFRKKWDVINGDRVDRSSGKAFTWDLNPFVWVVGFERLKTAGKAGKS